MSALTNPFLYLKNNADQNPRGIFSKSSDASVTNAEALVSVKKIAYELRRLGVKPGDVVALDLPDQLGILFTEAVFHEAAVSTVLPDKYVADGAFEVDWVFSSRTPRAQGDATLVSVDGRFLRDVETNPYGISPREDPIEILRIVFSSGTTGRPNALAMGRGMELVLDASLDSWFRGNPSLTLMDIGTPRGIGEFYLSVRGDRPFLCAGGSTPVQIARLAVGNSIKSLTGSAAQVFALLAVLEEHGQSLPTLEIVTVAGTSIPPGMAARLQAVTGGCHIIGQYGSTEAGAAARRVQTGSDDPFDVGQLLPGTVLEIVDDTDQPLPPGETGRIRYRSPGMSTEYLGNPSATAKAFRDGWFYPGDLGYLRADGGLTLAGRESEILNAGGVKVDPNRLDQFALLQPGVRDACSFEYTTGSGIRAIGMALATDDAADPAAIVAALSAEFGDAAPMLVARVPEIPRNSAGKPMRRELGERYSEV